MSDEQKSRSKRRRRNFNDEIGKIEKKIIVQMQHKYIFALNLGLIDVGQHELGVMVCVVTV
jgi:hypothetical protein